MGDASQAALLQKLGMQPFAYGLVVQHVYDNGSLFEPDVLALTDDMILGSFHAGVRNVAALSVQLGMPSVVSVPYTVLLAFKNLLAVSVATDFDFKGSEKVKAYLKDPSAFAFAAGPATSGGGAAPAAAAAAVEEEEEEEEMAPAADLFGGGDDY